MSELRPDSAETRALLDKVQGGNRQALEDLLGRQRPLLRSFIEVRIDPRLAARVDPSDIVQEALVTVTQRMDDYLERRPMPFHLWVRKTAYERFLDVRKHHQKRARRSVDREEAWPNRSSLLLARPLLARGPSPSQQLAARERADRVGRAVARLADADREILLLRHAEDLPFEEIACLLDIEPAAARKRFGRALIRLQALLAEFGVLES
jgi:RNA polymerase sigma-70 factor (ECF subfamily)